MKSMPKIVLALSAVASFGASAEMFYSGQADADRRERNREEALASYRAGHTTPSATENAVRRDVHRAAEATRDVTHKSANAVRNAGHKTAEKAREISDRANAKFGEPMNVGKANPEGINPRNVSSASPTAPSNGTTK
jgi:hypothetical protein